MHYFGTRVKFCLYIASCKEDYNAQVIFSLFPSLSRRNQTFNYSPAYVSRGTFGWLSGNYTELNGNRFP